ncbi:MAG TPA: M20/M25/M40 family metallo-hydrolase [Candidatus Acidoferrum sp.]|nr:M20/M25/M40 family metallo-hydrolase [Candidatus Acidoferrum sp.]
MRLATLLVLCMLFAAPLPARSTEAPASSAASAEDEIARIVGHSFTGNGAVEFLEALTDGIGGRITGSPGSRAAAELILKELKGAGFDNAHSEEYKLTSVWEHGAATGEVVSPVERRLIVGSYGWVPGTSGPIEVPVTDYGLATADPAPPLDRFKGSAVIVDLRSSGLSTAYVGIRAVLAKRLASAGAAAMFIVSDKPDRMVYTSAFGFYPRAPLPVLSIASEDAAFLRRLLGKGQVKIRLDVQNSFTASPGTERNVVADLPGDDTREMVLLTAHFDDWDPAQGANDNGAGVAVVLEAARIFKRLGIRPRHTIRFVFFSGEEQLSNGSRAYIDRHQAELDSIRAVFNIDCGAHPPLGFKIHGRTDLEQPSRKLLEPLAALGAGRISLEADFDSDQETFIVAGVPIYSLYVEPQDYDARHHTIIDTFERVDPMMVKLETAVMAVAAYAVANADKRPGPRINPAEVQELLKRTGLLPLYQLEYAQENSRP